MSNSSHRDAANTAFLDKPPGSDRAVVMIYTVWPDAKTADAAGEALVRSGMAACVNMFPPATSIYTWQGKVTRTRETPMLIKTTAERTEEVQQAVDWLHPYEVPAFLVLDVADVAPAFGKWIFDQVQQ